MILDSKHLYNNLVPCFLGLSFLTYLPINSSLFLHSLEVRLYFSLTLKIYLRLPILDANRHFLVLTIRFLYGDKVLDGEKRSVIEVFAYESGRLQMTRVGEGVESIWSTVFIVQCFPPCTSYSYAQTSASVQHE